VANSIIRLPVNFAPIRSQKSKYFLRGRPNSVEFLKGCPYPRCNDATIPGLPCRGYQRFDARLNRWACTGSCSSAILPAPGEAESGSAGVQPDKEYPGRRCADGASDPWGIKPPGVFFVSIGYRSHALKRHRHQVTNFGSVSVRIRSLSLWLAGDRVAHAPIGDSPKGGP
jgi:hypothetical protein